MFSPVSHSQQWLRTAPFDGPTPREEVWTRLVNQKPAEQTTVHVSLGKPIQILSLKMANSENYASMVSSTSASRREIYSSRLEPVLNCPICALSASQASPQVNVYGAQYVTCPGCSHCFVKDRPSHEALKKFYAESETYQSTYADPKTLALRLQEVTEPKLDWVLQAYERKFGRAPRSALDVGAGSGHFVQAARKRGLRADGAEPSRSGRAFCRENFGFELLDADFLAEEGKFENYDVISFWGVLEHVSDPIAMLRAATRLCREHPETLIVAEVPRWTSLSTAIQCGFADTLIRHLDPLGHIHVFTDSSLASSFSMVGLRLSSAWYFGMDAYELAMQVSHATGSESSTERLKEMIPSLQEAADHAHFADTVVFAGYWPGDT